MKWIALSASRSVSCVRKTKFIRKNADLIAQDHPLHLPMMYSNSLSLLDKLPENISEDWKEAFIELARLVSITPFNEFKFIDKSRDCCENHRRYHDDAQKKAKDFLTRMNGSDAEKRKLAADKFQEAIDKMIKDAAKQGVIINATVE